MVRIAIYWGVWLILPVLVDGLTSLVQMAQVLVQHLRRSPHPPAPSPKGGEGGEEKRPVDHFGFRSVSYRISYP